MSIQLPSGVMVTGVSVKHNIPTFTTESISLKQRSKARNLHRLEGNVGISLYGLKNQKAWQAFLIKVKGRSDTIALDLPLHFKLLLSLLELNPRMQIELCQSDL